jgi:hypothetical protein
VGLGISISGGIELLKGKEILKIKAEVDSHHEQAFTWY